MTQRPDPLTAVFASYLPQMQLQMVVQRQTEAHEGWKRPSLQRHFGAVLFIDISGFTELTQQFEATGVTGTENLSGLLKSYFGLLAETILQNGGDIISFAGDAVLAVWTTEPSELPSAVFHSIAAARSVQSRLDVWKSPPGIVLRQRTAIGAGELVAMELGGIDGRYQFLLVGHPILDAALGTRQANPHEIVLSPSAWRMVSSKAAGETLGSGFVRLKDMRDSPDLISLPARFPQAFPLDGYVLPIVADRIRAGHDAWLGEFRHITVLFVQLGAFETGDENACSRLHSAVNVVSTILSQNEGSLYQFLMDDKGIVLVAIFGLPPLAHEDNSARGVGSALQLRSEMSRIGFQVSTGITTGRAFCGVLGMQARRQYTAVGAVMNLAARLMESARGRILCDEITFRSSRFRAGLSFQPKLNLAIKGKLEPVPVYPIEEADDWHSEEAGTITVGPMPERSAEEILVGRAEEYAILCDALERLIREKVGSTLIIEGESGIGKSRLIEYFLTSTCLGKVRFIFTAGDSIRSTSPYFAWQEVFRSLLQLDPLSDLLVRQTKVAAALGEQPDLYERLPLLSSVLQLDLPDNELTAQMSGKIRSENTRTFLAALLHYLTATEPHVLIVEDLQWLDSSSLALLTLVASQPGNLLLVLSTRPFAAAAPQEYEQLAALSKSHVKLAVLSQEQAMQIVRRCLGVQSLPLAIEDFLAQRAAGHPFFVQELARALRDTGLIRISDGQCVLPGDSSLSIDHAFTELHIPNTIQGVITSRVDRLSGKSQLLLKTASVIGRTFDLSLLQSILPEESDVRNLAKDLQQLESLELIRPVPREPDVREFDHAITQEVVYSGLAFARRRTIHKSVAEWHEEKFHQNLAQYYPILAHHWRQAEVNPKAIEYAAKAGQQALVRFANPEAVHFLRDALALDDEELQKALKQVAPVSETERAQWKVWLGQAMANVGNTKEARIQVEEGLIRLRQPVPRSSFKAACLFLVEVLRQLGQRLGLAVMDIRGTQNREMTLEVSRAYQGLTTIYFLENAPLLTLVASIRSLNLAELAGPCPELARGYASMAAILGLIPLRRAARSYFELALNAARSANDLEATAWVSLCNGIYDAGIGNWESATGLFQNMESICRRLGDQKNLGDALQCLGMVHYFKGHFNRSLEFTAQFCSAVARSRNPHLEAESLRWKAHNLLAMGRLEEFADCLTQLERMRCDHQGASILNLADVFALRAVLHLRTAEYALSLQLVHEAAERLARTSNTTHELILERSLIAEIYLRIWEHSQHSSLEFPDGRVISSSKPAGAVDCRRESRQACTALRRFARIFPIGQPLTWLWSGLQDYLEGRKSNAVTAWERSVSLSQQLNMHYVEGLAEYEIGRHLPDGDARRKRLERAYNIFISLNAVHDAAQAESALQLV